MVGTTWLIWFVVFVFAFVVLRKVTQRFVPKFSMLLTVVALAVLFLVVYYGLGVNLLDFGA